MSGIGVSICVFCGANPGSSPAFSAAATSLGAAIASAGHRLVYGGGRVGLMGTVADAALRAGGDVMGCIPESLTGKEVEHTGLSELIVTSSMHTRKERMADESNGFVVLPGGFGTLDEVLEILTWNQLGLIAKPVVFLDVDGYFSALFGFFDHAVDSGLIKPAHRSMAQRATSAERAVEIAAGPAPASPGKWTELPDVGAAR